MINLSNKDVIMVVAAHPDDEILGCGGTINKWTNQGAEAQALVLGTGMGARGDLDKASLDEAIAELRNNAKASAKIIGYKTVNFENFPDNRLDEVSLLDIVVKISAYAVVLRPTIVLTHHHGDLNLDHRLVYNAVITAFRPLKGCAVDTILSFETPSSTEWNFPYYKNTFSPNVFVNIENNLEAKLRALDCYESEIREAPHPRSPESIRAIAKRWGSVVNLQYAEAFELIRTSVL